MNIQTFSAVTRRWLVMAAAAIICVLLALGHDVTPAHASAATVVVNTRRRQTRLTNETTSSSCARR